MFVGTTDAGGSHDQGSLYGYIPEKVLGQTIYSFQGLDGRYPGESLASDRYSVYGVTLQGGANNLGTIFKYHRDTGLETLYSFTGKADGAHPRGNVFLGKDGNLYGVATSTSNENTLFKLNLANKTLTTLVSFGKNDNQAIAVFSIIQGSDGNFYGTTFVGGSSIFKVTPTGQLSTLYFWDTDLGAPTVIQGRDGDLYGITGGYISEPDGVPGTIFKLSLPKGGV
jgi:uncharacterized repeat protein (TIGR03803 family)